MQTGIDIHNNLKYSLFQYIQKSTSYLEEISSDPL